MLYDEWPDIRGEVKAGKFLLHQPETALSIAGRVVISSFPLGVGLLVIYLFVSGGAPKPVVEGPKVYAGWIILIAFFTGLGVVPLLSGIKLLLFRTRVALTSDTFLVQTCIGNVVIWKRRFSVPLFRLIKLRRVKRGPFGGVWRHVLSVDGENQSIDLAEFERRERALAIAQQIYSVIHLPVVDELPG